MAVYRFRVAFEDNEEVYREIDIKSSQHFEDFHFIILQSIGFDSKHNASFFISDDYWRKGDEITLQPDDEKEVFRRRREDLPIKKLMNKCKMASLIDDPHQKFVYIYDPKVAWTLLVELIKIVPDDAKAKYPKIVKSVEDAPKQYNTTNLLPPIEDESLLDEEVIADDDAYNLAHADDDIAGLEGEEGEETEEDEVGEDDMEEASDMEDHGHGDFEED